MVPGSDLLADALSVIDTYPVEVYQYLSRTLNEIGIWETSFAAEPTIYEASCQAVNRNQYVQLGLDFNKKYINAYLSADVGVLNRDMTSDKIVVGSKQYEIIGDLDWFEFDGWKAVLCVQILLTPPNTVGP